MATRYSFTLNDFSGGLVNTINDVKMLDNQSPDMLNMQFRNEGLIQKRPGTVFIEDLTGKTGYEQESILVDVIPYEYAPDKILKIYVMSDYAFYYEDDVKIIFWENPVQELPGVDENGDATFARMGVDRTLKYVHHNGSLIFTEGQYLYEFTYKYGEDPGVYRYVAPPKGFTPEPKPSVTGKTEFDLVKIGENGFKQGFYYLFDKWYEPCEYELEDGFKGSCLMPPSIGCLAIHKDRLYVSGCEEDPNMVFISDILNPLYFPSSLMLQTPPTDDYITALHVYNDDLIIGRRDSIYALTGNTNRDDSEYQYQLYKINTHTGMPNYCSANLVYHMMFFVGTDGNMYKLLPPSTTADSMYTVKLNTLLDITLPPFNLTPAYCGIARSVFDSTEGLWYVQLGQHTLVYHYELRAWTRYSNINATSFFKKNNVVYFVSLNNAVYKMPSRDGNQKYYDDVYDPGIGKVIQLPVCAYWTSRNMDMGQPARVKQFRDTYVVSESFEDYYTTVNLKYEVDYIDIYSDFVIENEIGKWDKAVFDKSKFTSRNIDRSLPLMINRRGRTLKVYYGCGYEYVGVYLEKPVPGEIEEYKIIYLKSEDKLYLRVPKREEYIDKFDRYFREITNEDLNQALLVHNLTGIYEIKGFR